MNKKIFIIAGVILVLAVVVGVFAVVLNRGGKNVFQSSNNGVADKLPGQEVHIKSFGFQPDAMLLKKGTTVTWINDDTVPHQIQFKDFASKEIAPGKKFSHTFETRGINDYICTLHPETKARIVIE